MLYFIGLKLPYDLKEEVKRLHGLLGVGSHTTAPPHMSFIPTFELKKDDDFFIHDLEDLFKNTKPFTLKIKGLGSFRNANDHNVVYMDVLDTPALEKLREDLCDTLKEKIRNTRMILRSDFHITISKKLTAQELDYSIEKLKDYYIEREFIVDRLYLFRVETNKPWKEFKVFELKSLKKELIK